MHFRLFHVFGVYVDLWRNHKTIECKMYLLFDDNSIGGFYFVEFCLFARAMAFVLIYNCWCLYILCCVHLNLAQNIQFAERWHQSIKFTATANVRI